MEDDFDAFIVPPIQQLKETPSAADLVDKTKSCILIPLPSPHTTEDYLRRKRVTIMECADDAAPARAAIVRVSPANPLVRTVAMGGFSLPGSTTNNSSTKGSTTPNSSTKGSATSNSSTKGSTTSNSSVKGSATPKSSQSGSSTPRMSISGTSTPLLSSTSAQAPTLSLLT